MTASERRFWSQASFPLVLSERTVTREQRKAQEPQNSRRKCSKAAGNEKRTEGPLQETQPAPADHQSGGGSGCFCISELSRG